MELRPGGSGGGSAAPSNPNALTVGVPTMGRDMPLINTVPMTSGTVRYSYFTAAADATVTKIRTWCGGTPATVPTGNWIGLYKEEANGNLTLVNGAVDMTQWLAANTAYTLTIPSSVITAGQRYALSVEYNTSTGTTPTLGGSNQQFAQEMAEAPRMTGQWAGQAGLVATVLAANIANSPYRIYGVFLP